MTTFLLPLTNVPQKFDIALAGINYILTSKWNDSLEGGWVLDIANADTNESIVANVPLIAGGDCLAGLEYLGIGGQMIVFTDGDEQAVPTLENLGVESNLYFLTDVASG